MNDITHVEVRLPHRYMHRHMRVSDQQEHYKKNYTVLYHIGIVTGVFRVCDTGVCV